MNAQKLMGKFIVLDGPDGTGKSTQIQLLSNLIKNNGTDVAVFRDPGGTPIGEQIRRILLNPDHHLMSVRCEALLYMASRAQLYSECIAPALDQGKCVLCDRWLSSTVAYQAVAGKLGSHKILAIAEASLERSWPDLTLILDLPVKLSFQRLSERPDRMEQKGQEFQSHVRKAFINIAAARPDFHIIDASGSVEQVHDRICKVLDHVYP